MTDASRSAQARLSSHCRCGDPVLSCFLYSPRSAPAQAFPCQAVLLVSLSWNLRPVPRPLWEVGEA